MRWWCKAARGWSSLWAPLAAAMAARCLGNAHGGEFNTFYRRACLEEGVTTVYSMGTARQWRDATANSSAGAARRAYDDVAVGWPARSA
jgi:hypothetical protein